MMNNLFSTFDPCTGMLSLNWLSSLLVLTMITNSFWVMKSNMEKMINKTMKKLITEANSLMNTKKPMLMFMSMFTFILLNNLMGLLPYVFTSPSHLVFSVSMALPTWLGLMIFGWTKKTNKMLIHMVPIGTPSMIMPFMVMIETISNLIRPTSLAVRLTANMIAGHLLMSLLGSSNNLMMIISLMVMYMILMMFETAVSMIQAYVFMTLSTLYSSEI